MMYFYLLELSLFREDMMDWQSALVPGKGPEGKSIISVIAKRTYEITPGNIFHATEQLPLNSADIPADPSDLYYSENLAETDLVAYKPFTDIVVLGKAYSPKGKKAFHLECEVLVGPAKKTIKVFGERKVESKLMRGLYFTDPIPFEEMDIGFSNAYGGRAKSKDGTLYPFPPNPLGKGFYLKGGFEEYSEIVVPSVEHPESPIEPENLICDKFDDWKNAPKPASFGWTKQGFFPRFTYAGVIPELPGALAAGFEINPNLPKLNLRFFQGASEGLCNHVLKGDEHVKLTYLDPENPVFEFDLLGEKPAITITIGSEKCGLEPVLQTLLIFKEFNLMTMVWRGSKEVKGTIEQIAKMQSSFHSHPTGVTAPLFPLLNRHI